MTDTIDLPRSKRLKALTHEVHDRLDKSIMEASSFDSLEGYGRFAAAGFKKVPCGKQIEALVFRAVQRVQHGHKVRPESLPG